MKTNLQFRKETWPLIPQSSMISRISIFSTRSKRRGVSEVISTLLLIAITVVGAVMVSNYFQHTGVTNLATQFSSSALQPQISASLQLTGYDTRDGAGLSGINSTTTNTNLDNIYDSNHLFLCTKSCNTNSNNVPATCTPSCSGGTDFIVLRIKNVGIGTVSIKDVTLNNIDHTWASGTTGNLIISNPPNPTGKYPYSGQFVIIPTANTNPIQIITTNQLQSGNEVRLVIKLSTSLVVSSNDPGFNIPLTIRIITGNPNPPTFAILTGDIM